MVMPSKKSQRENSKDGRKFHKASKKPFKTTKNKPDEVQSEALALQLEDDVPVFPRGWIFFFVKKLNVACGSLHYKGIMTESGFCTMLVLLNQKIT